MDVGVGVCMCDSPPLPKGPVEWYHMVTQVVPKIVPKQVIKRQQMIPKIILNLLLKVVR